MSTFRAWVVSCLCIMTVCGCGPRGLALSPRSAPRAGGISLDAPYVPTRPEVISQMLRVARVGPADTLYDLGCGDGRIVITAARQFGARGVGIDLEPARIRESRENAARERVDDRVRFMQGDLFAVDLSEATVVTLYLLTSVNVKLRPRLLAQLAPGTRLVSHDFSMEDWTPDVTLTEGQDTIHFWVVPANASGVWQWDAPGEHGARVQTLTITQRFQEVVGTWNDGRETLPITDARLTGARLSFRLVRQTGEDKITPVRFEGVVRGDRIEGTSYRGTGASVGTAWRAARRPGTGKPLDAPPVSP